VYLRPKFFLLGSSLAFSPKEDPVRCAKVCNESWVIPKIPLPSCHNKTHFPGAEFNHIVKYEHEEIRAFQAFNKLSCLTDNGRISIFPIPESVFVSMQ
jgi:hypothetical protein